MVLTVHVPFMLILNEGIAPRLPRSLVVDDVDLEWRGASFYTHIPRTSPVRGDGGIKNIDIPV